MLDKTWFADLRGRSPVILPSMLMCDFTDLRREIGRLEDAGAAALHLDVMDGQFVPNFTYGLPLVAAMRQCTALPLDVHLMMQRPDQYLSQFRDAGADGLTVHAEAVADLGTVLAEIHRLGAAAGVALNPQTPLAVLEPHLAQCDLVLIMSVQAGFGGQAFQPTVLSKVREIRQRLPPAAVVQMDGGINLDTIRDCATAGTNWFVVGSGIFRQSDYAVALRDLRNQAAGLN